MKNPQRNEVSLRKIKVSHLAVATMAIGGLAAPFLAVGTANAATSGVTVSVAKNAKLGTFLVSGKTLYTLKASKTACTAKCLKTWPELVLPKGVKKATAGSGVSAAKLGTITRAGGVLQVTYAGKPLYFFIKDTKAGQVKGNVTDDWGKWSTFITVKPASSSGSGSGSSNTGTGGVAF